MSEKKAPTPISSFASIFIGQVHRFLSRDPRETRHPAASCLAMSLGDVVDRDVLRVVVVPDGPLGTDRWQLLEVVVDGGERGEPLESAGIPGVVRGLHDVLAPYRQTDVPEHEEEREPDHPATDARRDVEALPPEVRRVSGDTPRHPFEPEHVLRASSSARSR